MQVIIHFGPPKTGTSAIQNWLLNHRDLLIKYGIFYPKHDLDKNGISSGNVSAIYSTPKAKLKDARLKKAELIELCRQHKCRTLLLSSEAFMRRLPELGKLFPKALFIGYIRAPLELLESGYNQQVKRHDETEVFSLEKRVEINHLKKISPMIEEIGVDRFKLKAFNKNAFHNNDLVSDFLETLIPKFTNEQDIKTDKQINLSYTLEALEVKRWLNSLGLDKPTLRAADHALQRLQGTKNYSLLSALEYSTQQDASFEDIISLNSICNIENIETLLSSVRSKPQKPFVTQDISERERNEILQKIFPEVPELKSTLEALGVTALN